MVEGEFEFFDGTSWKPFRRGEVRYSLRGTYHGFRNVGQTKGVTMFTTNGGGPDKYFAEISSLDLSKDMERLVFKAAIAPRVKPMFSIISLTGSMFAGALYLLQKPHYVPVV